MKGSIINSNNLPLANTEENRRIRGTIMAYNEYNTNKTLQNLLNYLSNVANKHLQF